MSRGETLAVGIPIQCVPTPTGILGKGTRPSAVVRHIAVADGGKTGTVGRTTTTSAVIIVIIIIIISISVIVIS